MLDTSAFDYELPPELIAQFPSRKRSQSRLFVLDRKGSANLHLKFRDIAKFFNPGDALVVNTTKVFKARLLGHRQSGGAVEVFLVRAVSSAGGEVWQALVKPSRKLKEGENVWFDDRVAVTLERNLGEGAWQVGFSSRSARERIVARFGHVPLPQYIDRTDTPSDIRRYQTVFADRERVGAVAAPTAGFHFTRGLIEKLEQAGVEVVRLTLHVGPGTFKPITASNIEGHVVDPEFAELDEIAAKQLSQVRDRGGAIFAVGTTSVRTMESARIERGEVLPFAKMVDLYIRPGYRFQLVDHLITNFHLPKSSLLVLVSAFAGRERVLAAYAEAIERRYRFYSYGDAMLML